MDNKQAFRIVYDWMREPDWADNFTMADLRDWLHQRPVAALRQLNPDAPDMVEKPAELYLEIVDAE